METLSVLYLHAGASLRNSVKLENNFLKTYSLMTYLGFDLKYLRGRGEGGGGQGEAKRAWQDLSDGD